MRAEPVELRTARAGVHTAAGELLEVAERSYPTDQRPPEYPIAALR
jgi:hypothetical protein